MRWIKHLSDAHADEKLAILRAEAGFEGYGFYWFVLEAIAKHVDGNSGKTSLTYPAKFWASFAGVSTRVFQRLAQTCAKLNLFAVEISGNLITIDCPNILKYRDEWASRKSKNSGVTREQLGCKDTDTDTELNTKDKPSKTRVCGAPENSGTPLEQVDEGEIKGTLPLRDGSDFEVREKYYAELAALFPGLDIRQQFASMKAWLSASPDRRKTRRGIRRFVANWLTRAADRGAGRQKPAKPEYRGGM